jgi:hypothetical protein
MYPGATAVAPRHCLKGSTLPCLAPIILATSFTFFSVFICSFGPFIKGIVKKQKICINLFASIFPKNGLLFKIRLFLAELQNSIIVVISFKNLFFFLVHPFLVDTPTNSTYYKERLETSLNFYFNHYS